MTEKQVHRTMISQNWHEREVTFAGMSLILPEDQYEATNFIWASSEARPLS